MAAWARAHDGRRTRELRGVGRHRGHWRSSACSRSSPRRCLGDASGSCPPTTDLMFGTVPIAHAGLARSGSPTRSPTTSSPRAEAGRTWRASTGCPQGSPWSGRVRAAVWPSPTGSTTERHAVRLVLHRASLRHWTLGWRARDRDFRQGVGRRARRAEERASGSSRPRTRPRSWSGCRTCRRSTSGARRLRGGEGYRFDDDMVTDDRHGARALSPAGSIRALGARARRRGHRGDPGPCAPGRAMSCWLTGYDPEWSRFGPGVAALLESIAAGSRAGCDVADLGLGDQPYKGASRTGPSPLESVTWCRPRLARLLQLGSRRTCAARTTSQAG